MKKSIETFLNNPSRTIDVAQIAVLAGIAGGIPLYMGRPDLALIAAPLGAIASAASIESERATQDLARKYTLRDRLRAGVSNYLLFATAGAAAGTWFNTPETIVAGAAMGTFIAGGVERFVHRYRMRIAQSEVGSQPTPIQPEPDLPQPDHSKQSPRHAA
jgi:hypothetical protein